MTQETRNEITKISKQFAKGIGRPINGSTFLIVDPLSAYLSFLGYKNTVSQMPKTERNPMVLFMEFENGDKFIPAGGDLKKIHPEFKNWDWIIKNDQP